MKTGKILVLASLLPLLFVLVSCSQKNAAEKPSETAAASALSESSQLLLALLPKSNEVPGWSMTDKPRFFDSANLWEFIDGGAEGYLAYGFQEVVTADYSQGKTQLVIDMYHMKDATNAFGIYAQERNPASQFIKLGVEGYLGGTALNFWAGPYYVKLTAFEDQDAVKQEMIKIAGHISGKLTNAGAEPVEVGWFPKENQLARSVKYIPKDVLGQSYLTNAFESRYKTGDSEYKILVVEMMNPDPTKEAFTRYRQFIANQHQEIKNLAASGSDEGFSGEDSFYGKMMAVRAGTFIVIVLGAPSPALGNAAVAECLANIKKALPIT